MADSFAKELVGSKIVFVLVGEAGQWHGTLQDVGEQWVKVLVGKGKPTLFPITNIRSMAPDEEIVENPVNR